MRRSTFRCTPGMENLEQRQVLSAGGPSAEAQYMLEMLNEARTNPAAAAERATSNLDGEVKATINYYAVDLGRVKQEIASTPAKPPLAWSEDLAEAADWQSRDQVSLNYQGHERPDGSGPRLNDRLSNAGYKNAVSTGENAYAYAKSVDVAMKAFLIDWGVADRGHFKNIMQPGVSNQSAYREVGIGIVNTSGGSLGPKVITQDFGTRAGEKASLVGVVYSDQNRDHFYSVGEGRGDVAIEVITAVGGKSVASASTWSSGGYQISLDPGIYRVIARQGGQQWTSGAVTVGHENKKVDFDLSQPADAVVTEAPKQETVRVEAQKVEKPVEVVAPVAKANESESKPAKSSPTVTETVATPAQESTPKSTQESTTTPSNTDTLPGTGDPSWPLSWTSWTGTTKKKS